MRKFVGLMCISVLAAACGGVSGSSGGANPGSSAAAATDWSFPAENVLANGSKQQVTYKPIATDKVTKPWKICVLFPHMKDSYWLAADYGVVTESQRDKLNMQMYEAGGYTNLSTQLNQIDDCITQGFDAIVLGAISSKGVAAKVDQALAKGIPVIDFVNGIDDPQVSGHALVSFYDLAVTTAKFIVDDSKGKPVNVAYFPGPEGAGWSDDAVRGFNDTVKGTNVKLVVTRRGDTGENIQLNLIQDALKAYSNADYVVGVDIAAQAGVVAVRNANLQGKVKVLAFDIIPPVYDAIKNGGAVGSPSDFTTIQGRMAIDEAVRLLEKEKLAAPRTGPVPKMVTKANIDSIPYTDMFAARDFKATYTVKP